MKNGLKGVTDAMVFCKSMQKGGPAPMIKSMKKYSEGGMTSADSECSGWPPGKKCHGFNRKAVSRDTRRAQRRPRN